MERIEKPALQRVDLAPTALEDYEPVVGRETIEGLRARAKKLRGARVAHVNATPYGGGVSELLRSLVPLYRALEVEADWLVIPGSQHFFEVTKGIHNALQGGRFPLTDEAKQTYIRHNEMVGTALENHYDCIVVHDPQPAQRRRLHGRNRSRWVWRCHIDTSNPDPEMLAFLAPFIADYDVRVFTMQQFVPAGLREQRYVVMAPAIDPLSPKNMAMPTELTHRIIAWAGVHHDRPLMTQVSRFDPWKDPMGVIEVYRRVREQMPSIQLALLGQMALDDPEGWDIYHQIVDEARGDDDLHVLTNFTGIGNMEVNAFQCCSDIVLQKSLREGFGLVVSETLWKGTPVVAGRAGGIPLQMPEGTGGYLVESIDDCVEKAVRLLHDRQEAQQLGAAGRRHVREHFLITRLLADELELVSSLL